MAARFGRHQITSPATSREVIELLENASRDGSLAATINARNPANGESTLLDLTVGQRRPVTMGLEYVVKLADGSPATITAFTHPDLEATPANLTLARRTTP